MNHVVLPQLPISNDVLITGVFYDITIQAFVQDSWELRKTKSLCLFKIPILSFKNVKYVTITFLHL